MKFDAIKLMFDREFLNKTKKPIFKAIGIEMLVRNKT